jgi:septal ring factor EnvC (AmiA/AmiB activator)
MILKLLAKLFEFVFNQSRDVDKNNWKWKLLYIVPVFVGCAITVVAAVVGDKALETYDQTVERNLEMTKSTLGAKDELNIALKDQIFHLKGQIKDLETRINYVNRELAAVRRENELDGATIKALESAKKLLEEELQRLSSEVTWWRKQDREQKARRK